MVIILGVLIFRTFTVVLGIFLASLFSFLSPVCGCFIYFIFFVAFFSVF